MKSYRFEADCSYTALNEKRLFSSMIGYPDDTIWPEVLKDFVKFLSLEYGYDLTEQVAIIKPDNTFIRVSEI